MGIPDTRNVPSSFLAAPFSLEELAASPLCVEGLAERQAQPRRSDLHSPVAYLEFEDSCHPGEGPVQPLYLAGSATSSLDVARVLGMHGLLPVWGSILVLNQTTGRGQLGRTWASPAGNIYAALRLPFEPPFTGTAAAPAIGALLAEALTELGCPVRMKWPNDLVRGREEGCSNWNKVGGILLEERPLPNAADVPPEEAALLVAGIGLNIISSPSEDKMREGHVMPAGCLPSIGGTAGRPLSLVEFWTRVVRHTVFCYVREIKSKLPHAWRFIGERRLAFLGQSVLLVDGSGNSECHEGILEGLDESGGLRLRGSDGSESFLSGTLCQPSRLAAGCSVSGMASCGTSVPGGKAFT